VATVYLFSSVGVYKIFTQNKVKTVLFNVFTILPVVFIFSNIFTKKIFFITGGMKYYETNFIYVTTLFSLVFIICGICLMWVYRRGISKIKVYLALIIYSVIIILISLQWFNFFREIEMFNLSMCAYLVLLFTQRPELMINTSVNAKSADAFSEESRQTFLLGRERSVVFIKIVNHKNISMYIGQENYSGFLEYISDILFCITSQYKDVFDIYYPGDAFFVLSCEIADKKILLKVADEINYELNKKIAYSDFELKCEISLCVFDIPGDINDVEFFEYFTLNFDKIIGKTLEPVLIKNISSTIEFKIKSEIEKIISNAIKNNHFEVFFQPVYGVKENRFVSAEALLRLKDPVYGYIPPSVFIPVAEGNGLIYKLGDFVLREVCKFISNDAFSALNLDYIEINLSKSQCVQANLVDKFIEAINDYGISPERIRLEITEDSADFKPVIAEQNIRALHDMGIVFALDDYGTGYSNIKKVTSLPFKVVKFDKSFVDEMNNGLMWNVIQDSIHMFKELKMEIFVEGIENKNEADSFKNLNVDYIQGYYYSTPLPEEEFIQFIRHKKS